MAVYSGRYNSTDLWSLDSQKEKFDKEHKEREKAEDIKVSPDSNLSYSDLANRARKFYEVEEGQHTDDIKLFQDLIDNDPRVLNLLNEEQQNRFFNDLDSAYVQAGMKAKEGEEGTFMSVPLPENVGFKTFANAFAKKTEMFLYNIGMGALTAAQEFTDPGLAKNIKEAERLQYKAKWESENPDGDWDSLGSTQYNKYLEENPE